LLRRRSKVMLSSLRRREGMEGEEGEGEEGGEGQGEECETSEEQRDEVTERGRERGTEMGKGLAREEKDIRVDEGLLDSVSLVSLVSLPKASEPMGDISPLGPYANMVFCEGRESEGEGGRREKKGGGGRTKREREREREGERERGRQKIERRETER